MDVRSILLAALLGAAATVGSGTVSAQSRARDAARPERPAGTKPSAEREVAPDADPPPEADPPRRGPVMRSMPRWRQPGRGSS
jgi:hypothetical protein